VVKVETDDTDCTQVSLPTWKQREGVKETQLIAHGVAAVLRKEGHEVDLLPTTIVFDAHDDAGILHEMMQALHEDSKAA
jgi:hypothetical protein